MSTNCVLPNRNVIILTLFFVLSLFSFQSKASTIASVQSVSVFSENEQTTEPETDVAPLKKKDKKKIKERDKYEVQINENFFINLGINLAAVLLIIFVIYYPTHRKMDTIFTFILFNVIIFLLTFVLNKVKISMGAAFGLFAVFSMLRYRTEGIDIKDMTYLFIFIALGLLSGIQMEYYELGLICAIIFVVTLLLDTKLVIKRESLQEVTYERIELIKPENREQLISDLKERTGLNIHRIAIKELNFLRDSADIIIYYYE